MRKLDKATLVELIENQRKFGEFIGKATDEELMELLRKSSDIAKRLVGIYLASELVSFIQSIVGRYGLKTKATNEEIFGMLALLGWEVE